MENKSYRKILGIYLTLYKIYMMLSMVKNKRGISYNENYCIQ